MNAGAHILLPAAAWGEKDGTVTNSERRISRQRAFLPPPGEAKPDWWIVAQVAHRMGFGDAFGYRLGGRYFSRTRGAVGVRKRRHARFRHRRAGDSSTTTRSMRSIRCNGPHAPGALATSSAFSRDGELLHADRKARLIAPEMPAPSAATSAQISVPPQHRPRARSVAHHDALRLKPAAGGTACRRTVCRGASRTMPRQSAWRTAASRACVRPTARACSRSSSATASSAARCSRRSIGATRPHPARASANW